MTTGRRGPLLHIPPRVIRRHNVAVLSTKIALDWSSTSYATPLIWNITTTPYENGELSPHYSSHGELSPHFFFLSFFFKVNSHPIALFLKVNSHPNTLLMVNSHPISFSFSFFFFFFLGELSPHCSFPR